jgi:uncharacterized membrane protein YidH (DUF202 family)
MDYPDMKEKTVEQLARVGLVAKGVVYVLLGALAFTAAAGLGSATANQASQSNALVELKQRTGGTLLLAVLLAGLLCYCVWRFVQSFSGNDKKTTKRVRYFLSGLAYSSLAYSALRLLLHNKRGGDQQQQLTASFLSKPFGEVLVFAVALIVAGIGIYQVYYGLSEKYRKHVQGLTQRENTAQLLLASGKVGYPARGIVWLIVSYLLLKAALQHDASEAGNTGKAFQFVKESPLGSYFLGAIGLGLVTYGIFNFIRAKYERLP